MNYYSQEIEIRFQNIIKELLQNKLRIWIRINPHGLGGGMRRTGRMPIDDNDTYADLDKLDE